MYRTPPREAMETRSAALKKALAGEATVSRSQVASPVAGTAASTVTSSVKARRAQLRYEAEKQKAEIQMKLIEKKLEADLLSIDEEHETSYRMSRRSISVDDWLDNNRELMEPAPVSNNEETTAGHQLNVHRKIEATVHPPKECQEPPEGTPEMNAIRTLATAISEMATKSSTEKHLMTRLCAPKHLPEYSGDPLEWLAFKQAYNQSTELCQFSPQENLWRLRKSLRGVAKEAVAALLITATSPDTIIDTLELQFGNPDLIISKIMQDIKKIQPLPHDYQKDIIQFSIKIQNLVEAVKAVKREDYLEGMAIVSLLISKLPSILLSKWADYSYPIISSQQKSRVIILADFLRQEAQKVSITLPVNVCLASTSHKCDHKGDGFHKHKFSSGRQAVLIQAQEEIKCTFCRKINCRSLSECKLFKKSLVRTRWQFVKRHRLCFKCLNRHSEPEREGCDAPPCNAENCGRAHHRLLHYNVRQRQDEPAQDEAQTVTHIKSQECKVLLKVIPIKIHTPTRVIKASALCDDGSTVSLLSGKLARQLDLTGRVQTMRISGAFGGDQVTYESLVTDVNLSGVDGKIHCVKMHCVDNLDLPVQCFSIVKANNFSNIRDIVNEICTTDSKPDILIGQDNFTLLQPLKVRVGKGGEPSATLTPLGWCVHGLMRSSRVVEGCSRTDSVVDDHTSLLMSSVTNEDQSLLELHEQVRYWFSLESLGVASKPRQNENHVRAIAQLEKTAKLINGRWHVGLPWKDELSDMPDSYPNAFKRLRGIEKKMQRDKGFAGRYRERVSHLLDNDFAEKLSRLPCNLPPKRTWYLPHFGVDNPNKKKMRLVFDAADRVNGKGLNDFLLTGPDLLCSLFGIMLRFRENKIGVAGDIKDMFLRVKIHPEDQHALRFLWRNRPEDEVETYVMTSLIFGANCSPFVAQFIKKFNARRFESSMPSAVKAICCSHYMDDYIDSLPTTKIAKETVRDVIKIHQEGGFEIRNWTSNSITVLDSLPRESLGPAAVNFKVGLQNEGERTLGLIWFPKDDVLAFDLSFKKIPEDILLKKKKPTKRVMLRVIMSIFDIYGFLAPFTVQGKILLQDTWRLNIGWDDVVPDTVNEKWCLWLDLLNNVRSLRIPRFYHANSISTFEEAEISNETYDNLELHVFSDASTKAMCAVAYWRWNKNGEIRVAFISSKCRVVPVKPLTVPRSELQAALLAARLADVIIKEHRIKPVQRIFWCDSTTVLQWIRNNTRTYKAFIANRLGEIDDLTSSQEWRYVPTKLNVADLATREQFDSTLFQKQWIHGPEFLSSKVSCWPEEVIMAEADEALLECVALTVDSTVKLPIPNPQRFSCWLRLLRATSCVLRFIDKCRGLPGEMNTEVMSRAERLLLKQSQAESFAIEISAIQSGKRLSCDSKLRNLSPYLDEHGVLRIEGRIDAADVDLEMKRPIILGGEHAVTRLLIRNYHIKAAHGNQETIVNELKQKYWIIRLRPTVKTVISKCMFCRIRKCKPEVPRMGNLPEARMAKGHRPFTFCGIDLFGPINVTVGRGTQKRYGVLFTCLTVRAIYVEVVSSLTSDALIMALRRMAARRGWPSKIYSDNGTNLRGADKELKESLKDLDREALKEAGANIGLDWNYNPPSSPHWGGAWERLIRSVKTSLKVILKERAPKDEILNTLLAEVENIVNSRPLTHVSVDPSSLESLTPNHFLLGSSSNLPVIGSFDDSDLSLRKNWRKAQRLADMFWNRWVKEYLPQLLPRTKWTSEVADLQVGDLVLVVDPDTNRNVWPKGRIEAVYPGKDGRIRVVDVKTPTGVWRRSSARVARIHTGF